MIVYLCDGLEEYDVMCSFSFVQGHDTAQLYSVKSKQRGETVTGHFWGAGAQKGYKLTTDIQQKDISFSAFR